MYPPLEDLRRSPAPVGHAGGGQPSNSSESDRWGAVRRLCCLRPSRDFLWSPRLPLCGSSVSPPSSAMEAQMLCSDTVGLAGSVSGG
jgi:hypothetical protein